MKEDLTTIKCKFQGQCTTYDDNTIACLGIFSNAIYETYRIPQILKKYEELKKGDKLLC